MESRICKDELCAKPPIKECATDPDCPKNKECKQSKCVEIFIPYPTCSTDDSCPNGGMCYGGICINPGTEPTTTCNQDEDCKNGDMCHGGECIPLVTKRTFPSNHITTLAPKHLCKKDKDCKQPNICKRKTLPAICSPPTNGSILIFK